MTSPTLPFVTLLGLVTATRLWLLWRQRRAVSAARAEVPEEFAGEVPLEAHQKAADYTNAGIRVATVSVLLDAALALIVTVGGGLAWVDSFLRMQGLAGVPLGVAVIGVLAAASAIIGWPLSMYATFGVEARFGFNRTTWPLFVADTAKSIALTIALGGPLLAAVLWLMHRAGGSWWFYAWLVWFAFNLILVWAWPAFIAPWFNRFSPLADQALKARVEALIGRCGFAISGVFVMDSSRRSSHGNAYFTGFGRNRRIVLFDTLIARLPAEEVEAVIAHELGHYRLHHIRKRLISFAVLSLGALALLGWLAAQPAFYRAFGAVEPSPHAALVLFAIGAPLIGFWITPLGSAWSRRHEFEADAFATKHVEARALAHALMTLNKDNAKSLTPDTLYSFFYDSHPPARIRIARLKHVPA
ncbi:MAG: M48 family metallopeptidase [Steroidobacterales bacterium]